MEDPHFELDEQPMQVRSRQTSTGRFATIPGRRPPSDAASTDRGRREPEMAPVLNRLRDIEQQHRLLGLLFLTVVIGAVVAAFGLLSQGRAVTGKSLEMSEELKLVDSSGRPRLLVRLHSEVPVMQVLDVHGRSRLTLGLRFDDSPFIDLSDETGVTRVSLQVTSGGQATIRMFDRKGESTFTVH